MGQVTVSKEIYNKVYADYECQKIAVFISYSSADKSIAGCLKDLMEKFEMSAFLAHEDITPSRNWEKEIIKNLKKCQVFLPILSSSYIRSDWTAQETGFALALNKLVVPLKIDSDTNPYELIRHLQVLNLDSEDMKSSCAKIMIAINDNPSLKKSLINCLLSALEKANSFDSAEPVIEALNRLEPFNDKQMNQIIRVCIKNHQARNCSQGEKLAGLILEKHNSKIDPDLQRTYLLLKDTFDMIAPEEPQQ
jgi:hypothetical protein